MKSIVSFFNEFLRDEVNLNPTRLKVAKKGIKTLGKFLKRNELFKGKIKEIRPQGSYRQGTINKPFNDSDFDVDLLVLLDEFDDWQPKDYLNRLHQQFKGTERYKDIVDRKGKTKSLIDIGIRIDTSILEARGDGVKEEITKYKGKHYIECYALRENIVIATDSIYVNII
jgi:hypothetical protein